VRVPLNSDRVPVACNEATVPAGGIDQAVLLAPDRPSQQGLDHAVRGVVGTRMFLAEMLVHGGPLFRDSRETRLTPARAGCHGRPSIYTAAAETLRLRGDVLVVRWVDRLGRNYEDVCDVIREFMRRGVVIRTVINNFTFDGATKDPMQQAVRDALIGFMAATAQARKRRRRKPLSGPALSMRRPTTAAPTLAGNPATPGRNGVVQLTSSPKLGNLRQIGFRLKTRIFLFENAPRSRR